MKKWRVVLTAILSGVPTGIGALVGGIVGQMSQNAISICLGFAGGAMLYIVSGELVPESNQLHRGRISTFGNIFGIICGIIISFYGH
jgi:ZIP family zinc transporter